MGSRCPRLAAERRHGSWYLRTELGTGTDGRRRRVRRGGFPTRKTALEALVEENPASLVALPPTRRPRALVWTAARVQHWRKTGERPAVAVWTAAQTAQFLDAIAEHRLYAAYHVIALRGLRRGEAAGLRWCDLDLDEGTAIICRQLQRRDGRLTVGPPKTAHSTRVIALDRTTIAALRAHRSR